MKTFDTLDALVQRIAETHSNPAHLNRRVRDRWEAVSTETFVQSVRKLALGIRGLGLQDQEGFGILADPSPSWVMMDLAVIIAGGVSVPLFANISSENLGFEIRDSNMRFLYIAKAESWHAIQSRMDSFRSIVAQGSELTGSNVLTFEGLLAEGERADKADPGAYDRLRAAISGDRVATIIYTSGSTGVPKGVALTHRNLISQVQGAARCFPLDPAADRVFSCLPLAHIFERMVMYYYLSTGCGIYFSDDIKKVGEQLLDVRPTIMTMVPRLLEKVHAKILAKAALAHGLKGLLVKAALKRVQIREPGSPGGIQDALFNALVFKKMRRALGGRLKQIIVGGAALNPSMARFFLNAGFPLYEGYGQTEASPVIAVNFIGHRRVGSVGRAFPGVEIKIGSGEEILVKGPNVMKGYHNNEQATRETIDADGWLHTGDKGRLDADGYLYITGRIKEMFKTSNGKYVSPVPIEQALSQHEWIDMAMVVAEGRSFVSCLLVPDMDKIREFRKREGYLDGTDEEFLQSHKVQQEMAALLNRVNAKLNHWEQVHKFYLVPRPFAIETDELTPTMKIRRHVVEKKFKAEIDRMYEGT